MRDKSTILGAGLSLADLASRVNLDAVRVRFWSHVDCNGPDDCWPWVAHWDEHGRGKFALDGRTFPASRIAYLLAYGAIPDAQCVRHTCHTSRCVNPAHLILGTQAENVADMVRAGRARHRGTGTPREAVLRYQPRTFDSLAAKLDAGLDKRGADDCWMWTRGTSVGYGQIRGTLNGRPFHGHTHRLAYILAHGPIAAGLVVRHLCEGRYAPGDSAYRLCCNPTHLAVGSRADNRADMVAAGRHARDERHGSRTHPERVPHGERHGSRTHPERVPRGEQSGPRRHPERMRRGSLHPHAALNEEQVRAIRRLRAAGASLAELSALFGVVDTTISRIARGVRWGHLDAITAGEVHDGEA